MAEARIAPDIASYAQPLGSLEPHPRNPREGDVGAIAVSLEAFGQYAPIVYQKSRRHIIKGNHTWLAARSLGWNEVAAVGIDVDDERALAILLTDNRSSDRGTYDFPELAGIWRELPEGLREVTGYDAQDIDDILADLEGTHEVAFEARDHPGDPDEVPEPPSEPVTRPGDLWLLGEHRLVCGDATEAGVLGRALDGARARCVFTSPPYAVGVDYGPGYADTIESLRDLLRKSAPLWREHVLPGGFAIVNFVDIVGGRALAGSQDVCEYPMALEHWSIFREAGYALWSRRVWCKPNPRVDAPWTMQSNRAASDWEHVWTWKVPGKPAVGRVDGEFQSCLGHFDTTIRSDVVGKETFGAGMPSLTAVHLLATHTLPGDVVLEPFAGTGTTIVAAEEIGRRCAAVELWPRACDIAVLRWERYTGARARRIAADGATLPGMDEVEVALR